MPMSGIMLFDYETRLTTKVDYSKAGMTTYHVNLVRSLRKHMELQPT